MHIFKFSARKGTKAETMPMQISPIKKEERSKILLELSDKNEIEFLNSYIGKTVSVLFEEMEADFCKGHTANFLMVNVKSKHDLSGNIFNVKIENRENLELIGKIVEN